MAGNKFKAYGLEILYNFAKIDLITTISGKITTFKWMLQIFRHKFLSIFTKLDDTSVKKWYKYETSCIKMVQ